MWRSKWKVREYWKSDWEEEVTERGYGGGEGKRRLTVIVIGVGTQAR